MSKTLTRNKAMLLCLVAVCFLLPRTGQSLNVPFIPNRGQVDHRAVYYSIIDDGSIFITSHGEILYSLPKR
ncbi:hypothetical protein EP232_00535, partial [bacterium]